MNLQIEPALESDYKEISYLLNVNELPSSDITEDHVQIFVGLNQQEIIGTIGLQKYDSIGLLRSLVVKDGYKSQKIAGKLLHYIFDYCVMHKITELYLLTTSAEEYFYKYGFQKIERILVPEVIKETKQYQEICPKVAVVMHKSLL